jgi:C4-dicarboxylate-specific signal transduction histidine kinase
MSALPFQALLRLPGPVLAMIYVIVHLVLDWVTFVPGFSPLGITPWNPTTGLGFGLALLKGPHFVTLLMAGQLASELAFRASAVNLPLSVAVVEVVVTGLCYGLASWILLRRRPAFAPALDSVRDLLALGAVATLAAAAVAILYVGVLSAAGLLPAAEIAASALRYWIGETIGIMVMTPFVLLLLTTRQRIEVTRESVVQALAIVAAIGIVLGLGSRYQTQLFYVLFLPVVWVAVRKGLAGVSAALVLMQVGIMISLHLGRQDHVDVTEFQAVMLVLVGAGLTIGMLVRERQVSEARLRLLQDTMARGVRLASIDRFSSAMAHEVNQPLTAIANYARAAVRALGRDPVDLGLAREATTKALDEVTRAAEVVRRLRNLITLGRVELGVHRLAPIVAEVAELLRPDLARQGVRLEVSIPADCPPVLADLLQVEQVLTNLVRNSMEAMHEQPAASRRITVDVVPAAGAVTVAVSDTGPGFPAGFKLDSALPSPTTKAGALGVGLALSAAIVEAHGGKLVTSAAGAPGRVSFTLRIASGDGHGARH